MRAKPAAEEVKREEAQRVVCGRTPSLGCEDDALLLVGRNIMIADFALKSVFEQIGLTLTYAS